MTVSLQITEHQNYYEIQFHYPSGRNSFGVEQAKSLEHVLKKKHKKPILFYSKLEGVFCSGGNLKRYANMTKKESLKANRYLRKVLSKLKDYEELTLALVDGDCLGGGLEVLSTFDIVISSPRSLFALWQRKIGLSYGWGGGRRLKKRIGKENLKQYSITTKTLDAYRAKEIGLVDYVIQANEQFRFAKKLIDQHQKLPSSGNFIFFQYTEKKEVSFFEKIWGNPEHDKILDRFRN